MLEADHLTLLHIFILIAEVHNDQQSPPPPPLLDYGDNHQHCQSQLQSLLPAADEVEIIIDIKKRCLW